MRDTNPVPMESVTVVNASTVLAEGVAAIKAGQRVIDLSCIKTADSSAVAVLLAWQRAARELKATLQFINMPANLKSLTVLYDVDSFLADTSAA